MQINITIDQIQVSQTFDSIIIGAGISGITASIYLKRANLNILLLDKEYVGGQIVKTSIIENYPGIESINGADFALKLNNQIKSLDINYQMEEVIDIVDKDDYKEVITNKNTYKTKTILIATGRIPRKLGLKNEKKLIGNGISYCATCDGYFYKNKDIAIIGGGNSALEAALYLKNMCKSVTIINRSSKLKADQLLIDKCRDITILYNTKITELIEEDNKLVGLKLNDEQKLKIDGLFVYIGLIPTLSFINNLNLETYNDYIVVNDKMETNIKGIYAAGDIIEKEMYQIITAASEGAIASDQIKKYINEK